MTVHFFRSKQLVAQNPNSLFVEELDEQEEENDIIDVDTQRGREHTARLQRQSVINRVKKRVFSLGQQNGKLNPLPPNYKFPSMTTRQLIENWLIGNSAKNIPPLCTISADYIKHKKML